ncbi:DUF4352 domain-containing protein [Streptomyces niveiscabiei]|uniref:DUF4352 domain-containing protein n=1 Tax=Streptomyces niveiscabiei TaxID=164115 RepID=A0ABW9HNU2_9ACTN
MRRRTAPLLICLPAVFTLALAPLSSDGKVGDTLSLTGTTGDEKLDVTLVKVVDPAHAKETYLRADPGNRLVAMQFRLKNTGSDVYSDSPSNGAFVVDQDDQHFDASSGTPTTAGADFPGHVTVRPGDTALGYLTFEVPNGSRVTTVQFSMNSGYSDDIGKWTVSPTPPGPAAHRETARLP